MNKYVPINDQYTLCKNCGQPYKMHLSNGDEMLCQLKPILFTIKQPNPTSDLAIMQTALERFAKRGEEKFRAGMEKYKNVPGGIINRDLIAEAENEVIDMWMYLQALRVKLNNAPTSDANWIDQSRVLADTTRALEEARTLYQDKQREIDRLVGSNIMLRSKLSAIVEAVKNAEPNSPSTDSASAADNSPL